MYPPIRTALLAYGLSGRVFHAPFLSFDQGFNWLGAWERSTSKLPAQEPSLQSYPTLQAICDDPDVELVIVNTPNYLHAEHAEQCLRAGKHVVVEKASACSVADIQRLTALAKEHSLLFTVYQNRRWDSDFRAVQGVFQLGKLGPIHHAVLRMERFKPALSPKAHKETPGPGAGLLWDLGPHLFDQLIVLFGLPEFVSATARIMRADSAVWDDISACCIYADKMVHVELSLMRAPVLPAYSLFGQEGSMVQWRNDVQEDLLQAGQTPSERNPWGLPDASTAGHIVYANGRQEMVPVEAGDYRFFYQQLHRAIRHQEHPPVTPTEAVQLIQLLAAVEESAQTGRRISLLPKSNSL